MFPPPLGLNSDSKEVIPFHPRNSTLNGLQSRQTDLESRQNCCFFPLTVQLRFLALALHSSQELAARGCSTLPFIRLNINREIGQWPSPTGQAQPPAPHKTRGPQPPPAVLKEPVVQTRRTEALSGFRFGAPLHETKRHPAKRRVSAYWAPTTRLPFQVRIRARTSGGRHMPDGQSRVF
jgi:hypothetical protein